MVLMWLKDTEECRKGTMAVRKKDKYLADIGTRKKSLKLFNENVWKHEADVYTMMRLNGHHKNLQFQKLVE